MSNYYVDFNRKIKHKKELNKTKQKTKLEETLTNEQIKKNTEDQGLKST